METKATKTAHDWKRHSVPYDLPVDVTTHQATMGEMFDQAMEAFAAADNKAEVQSVQYQTTGTLGRERKNTFCAFSHEKSELSTDEFAPGVLKVFGETIVPGVQYKSVLASCRSTAQELVKQALERFGLPVSDYERYALCDVVGRYVSVGTNASSYTDDSTTASSSSRDRADKWERVLPRLLSDRDKPLMLQKFWKPIDGYSRRYELHERARVVDVADDDDTLGLNENARKILISKLRPGAIPLLDASALTRDTNGFPMGFRKFRSKVQTNMCSSSDGEMSQKRPKPGTSGPQELTSAIPLKQPFFVNIRGFDVKRDKVTYEIKYKRFNFGNPTLRNKNEAEVMPRFNLYAPDINAVHCNVKVYRFKRNNESNNPMADLNNYFLEIEPLADNISVNGHMIYTKTMVKSGDIIHFGIYYVLLFKDCSKGCDIPLALPWLQIPTMSHDSTSENESCDLNLTISSCEDCESNTTTDESTDVSVADRMCFAYAKEKENDMVKYICAIIQQQNTCKTYSLTVAYLFSMCIEHANRELERRQLKNLLLRILFTVRENVADADKSLSEGKFTCSLLNISSNLGERDQKLERLLLWMSNCVQLVLFLKHTFQPQDPNNASTMGLSRDQGPYYSRGAIQEPKLKKGAPKEDIAAHSLRQLVTGLEEITMHCFQQCIYTITKALHPLLPALLNSNPFSDNTSEQCSMAAIMRMLSTLAEVTHSVMLHEEITRQLFTYLFFFINTSVFNKLISEETGKRYYNIKGGVLAKSNLLQMQEWANQNGLDDEFFQTFERLLAVTELLATPNRELVKYQWAMIKTRYQPLTASQIYHMLSNYRLDKSRPFFLALTQDELKDIRNEVLMQLPLSEHPPFALPDNCGAVDLVRTPDDTSFWNHLRRLKFLYGITEDDSDSGFSISNTPRGSCITTNGEPFYKHESETDDAESAADGTYETPVKSVTPVYQSSGTMDTPVVHQRASSVPVSTRASGKQHNAPNWSFKVGLPTAKTGVCNCAGTSPCGEQSRETLASDLMNEELRDDTGVAEDTRVNNITHIDKCTDDLIASTDKSDLIATFQSRTCKSLLCTHSPQQREAACTNTVSQYQKHRSHGGNVADCSARAAPKTLHYRIRSNSAGLKTSFTDVKVKKERGCSDEEQLPLRPGHRKPSESFQEAMECGRISDIGKTISESLSTGKTITESLTTSVEDESLTCRYRTNHERSSVQGKVVTVSRTGLALKRNSSLRTENSSSIPTSQNEEKADTPCSGYEMSNSSPKTFPRIKTSVCQNTAAYFKPVSTSDVNLAYLHKRRCTVQKLNSVTFESQTRRSSIELTKDKLFVHNGDEIGYADVHVDSGSDDDAQDVFPGDMFTEVSAKTLAAMKRHGSTLNVAPSAENSPRTPQQNQVNIDNTNDSTDDTNSALENQTLTVHLEKQNGSVGIGLIDGMYTALQSPGIYIRKLLPASPAASSGRLQIGDKLLAVNGKNVSSATYQSTMQAIREAGDVLTLVVARGNESTATHIAISVV